MRGNNPLDFGLSPQVLGVSRCSKNSKALEKKYFTMFEPFHVYFAP
jgi:hypothetical protein